MGFSPIGAGDASIMHNSITVDGGAVYPLTNLTNSNLSMHYFNVDTGVLHVGTGNWTITNAALGQADYAPSAADVATTGTYKLYPVLSLATGPKPCDPQILVISNLP